jgi:hypothetical protein
LLVGRRKRRVERLWFLIQLRHRANHVGRGHARINDPGLFAPYVGKFRLRFATA